MQGAQIRQTNSLNQPAPAEKKCDTVDDITGILNAGRKAVYGLLHREAFPASRINSVGCKFPRKASMHGCIKQAVS